MHTELLTPDEMAKADRMAIERGPFDGTALMENAGRAVFREILARYPAARSYFVLCGPGNNGGDGYVVARLLHETGLHVEVYREGEPRRGSDAEKSAARCPVTARELADFAPGPGCLVVDALYGAGLSRPFSVDVCRASRAARDIGSSVVAVDVPSGLDGASGRHDPGGFSADLTVTFARLKPGHLLEPGRSACGEVVIADIGISERVVQAVGCRAFVNAPQLWRGKLLPPATDTHKYRRGHCAVFSGGPDATGASRLAAAAAARAGAGAVTVLAPVDAIAAQAAHLTSVMLREACGIDDVLDFLAQRKVASLVYGPGLGRRPEIATFLLDLLVQADAAISFVIDADGISGLEGRQPEFMAAAGAGGPRELVLTPHEGEFSRLFPDIAGNPRISKLDKARLAAARAGAVIVYKGPDTVIAAPDGRAAINANGTSWLATAGSGDVLSGIVAGLLSQRMPAWEAACAAVWLHADAAGRMGAGLIAEDLPEMLPAALAALLA